MRAGAKESMGKTGWHADDFEDGQKDPESRRQEANTFLALKLSKTTGPHQLVPELWPSEF